MVNMIIINNMSIIINLNIYNFLYLFSIIIFILFFNSLSLTTININSYLNHSTSHNFSFLIIKSIYICDFVIFSFVHKNLDFFVLLQEFQDYLQFQVELELLVHLHFSLLQLILKILNQL